MGQAVSRVTRPIRNFNIENRAAKTLVKREKIADAAPKHESTKQKLSQFREEHPELKATVTTKSDVLHERLKQIYVDSKDSPIEIRSSAKNPALSKEVRPDTDHGVMDVTYEVPKGKAELKTILSFIGQHQLDPKNVTAASIAQEYKLDEAEINNIFKHFRALQIYLPEEMFKENKNLKTIVQKQMTSGNMFPTQTKLPGQASDASLSDGVCPNKNQR